MGIFDRFRRRNQDSSVLPAEVDQYYQSEQRDRRGVAILLAIVTLIVTLLIATGLFFAGRFVYRKITDNDKPTTAQIESNKDKEQAAKEQQEANKSSNSAADNPSTAPATTPQSSPATPDQSSATVPSTGDQPPAGSLPRTGDEGM